MKSLILMRHSYAVSNNPAYSDRERPLTGEGRAIAQTTAELLIDSGIDKIICSSATRTVETADVIAAAVNSEIQALDRLYLAAAADYQTAAIELADQNDNVVLVVGHNPGIASLIMTWTGLSVPVAPCTVACFGLPTEDWNDAKDVSPELTDFISGGKRQALP